VISYVDVSNFVLIGNFLQRNWRIRSGYESLGCGKCGNILTSITKNRFFVIMDYCRFRFQIWTCGGTLEVVPCSRVAHVFRKRRPYGSPDNTDSFSLNAVRTAKVWLDEYVVRDYCSYWFSQLPTVSQFQSGQVLRKRTQCQKRGGR